MKCIESMTTEMQKLACDSRQEREPPAIPEGCELIKWAGPAMQASPKSFRTFAKRQSSSTMENLTAVLIMEPQLFLHTYPNFMWYKMHIKVYHKDSIFAKTYYNLHK
jgi:hypothetical protein